VFLKRRIGAIDIVGVVMDLVDLRKEGCNGCAA
jgi:hypothetical protein